MTKTQGYITLAMGEPEYVAMAANLAASIKVMDPKRRVCLIHDFPEGPDPTHAAFFDDIVFLPPDSRYPHIMNRFRLFDASPYDQTMCIDADCLLMKRDVDRYWEFAGQHYFCITGHPHTKGEWKGIRIEDMLAKYDIEYVVVMNAGVFYFDKSDESKAFFEEFGNFYLREFETLRLSASQGSKSPGGKARRSHSFELYLGIFMGMKRLLNIIMPNFDENSWMVTTWRIAFCRFDIAAGRSEIYKLSDFLFGLPILPTRVVRLSPTFPHFVGLKPKRTYARLAAEFRRIAASRAVQTADLAPAA